MIYAFLVFAVWHRTGLLQNPHIFDHAILSAVLQCPFAANFVVMYCPEEIFVNNHLFPEAKKHLAQNIFMTINNGIELFVFLHSFYVFQLVIIVHWILYIISLFIRHPYVAHPNAVHKLTYCKRAGRIF
jgi:hypothetical protein